MQKGSSVKKFSIPVAIIALAVVAFFLLPDKKGEPQASAAPEAAPLPQVGVVALKPQEVKITQELNGRVTPYLIAEVRPQVNGIIQNRKFEEGADVTKDMELYQIDPAMYDAELNQANANLAKAEANLNLAKIKLQRYEQLISARAVNQQEYDEVAAGNQQAEAEVGIAKAQVRLAQINVDYAKVTSPISGRIGKSNVTQGALVTASQAEPLAVVQQLDPIYVDVNQPISWMMNLKDDMQAGILQNTGESHAEVRLMLSNGQVYSEIGKLLFADITVDRTTGSISLRAEFPNPNHVLLPGMYVTALLDVAEKQDAITVPQRSLMRELDGSAYVFVVDDSGEVEKRPVTVIRSVDDKWLIGSGLDGSENVVIDGIQRIRFMPGAPAPRVQPIAVDLAVSVKPNRARNMN